MKKEYFLIKNNQWAITMAIVLLICIAFSAKLFFSNIISGAFSILIIGCIISFAVYKYFPGQYDILVIDRKNRAIEIRSSRLAISFTYQMVDILELSAIVTGLRARHVELKIGLKNGEERIYIFNLNSPANFLSTHSDEIPREINEFITTFNTVKGEK